MCGHLPARFQNSHADGYSDNADAQWLGQQNQSGYLNQVFLMGEAEEQHHSQA